MGKTNDIEWARTCDAGDYLHFWDDGDDSDIGSRGGRSDVEIADIKAELRKRGMLLITDGEGVRSEIS
jgi:hypothetical protein